MSIQGLLHQGLLNCSKIEKAADRFLAIPRALWRGKEVKVLVDSEKGIELKLQKKYSFARITGLFFSSVSGAGMGSGGVILFSIGIGIIFCATSLLALPLFLTGIILKRKALKLDEKANAHNEIINAALDSNFDSKLEKIEKIEENIHKCDDKIKKIEKTTNEIGKSLKKKEIKSTKTQGILEEKLKRCESEKKIVMNNKQVYKKELKTAEKKVYNSDIRLDKEELKELKEREEKIKTERLSIEKERNELTNERLDSSVWREVNKQRSRLNDKLSNNKKRLDRCQKQIAFTQNKIMRDEKLIKVIKTYQSIISIG